MSGLLLEYVNAFVVGILYTRALPRSFVLLPLVPSLKRAPVTSVVPSDERATRENQSPAASPLMSIPSLSQPIGPKPAKL